MKKKIIIIGIIYSILLISSVILALILPNKNNAKIKEKAEINSSWGNTYYVYLKNVKDTKKYDKAGLSDKIKKMKISFHEIENLKEPIMTITYEKDNENYINIYYINDNKVDVIVYEENTEMKYYYNTDTNSYGYYIKNEKNNTSNYISVKDQIEYQNNKENDLKTYTFTEQDKETVTDEFGNQLSVNKEDETFIEIITDEKEINYNFDLSDEELKKTINNTIDKYKTIEDIETKQVKENVANKIEEITTLKENIEKVKQENEQKAKEEEKKQDDNNSNSTNNELMTQEQADNIIKQKYNLNDDLSGETSGITQSFGSYGLVTYEGDNEKYYYYSSYNIFDTHSSYNGSVIVNAKTGKIKFVALTSREEPYDGIVPYNTEDQDID